MSLRRTLTPATLPVRGGAVTVRDKTQLRAGEFSWAQNVRNDHPGMISRKGQTKLHTTADSTNDVINLYQYRSIRGAEQKIFAQMSDGDLRAQDTSKLKIPDQYTGDPFEATAAHSGSSGQIPASFTNVRDHMIYSNGADQHQVYCGAGSLIDRFIVYDGAAEPADIPGMGRDYSDEIRNLNTRVAVLDSLNTYAAFECIFIKTKIPANSLTFDIFKPNGTASVLSLYYWNGSAWTDASATDGTISGGATFAIDGAITWTSPGSAEQEKFMYGQNGFWYQIRVSVQLDSEVEITSVLFDDNSLSDLRNIWDGTRVSGVEAQVYLAADGTRSVYGTEAVDIGGIGASDSLYMATADKAEAFYIDPGETPNDVSVTVSISYWNGAAWTACSGITDGTGGFFRPAWITFNRTTDEHPRELGAAHYNAYWYKITVNATLATTMTISITSMPYFNVEDYGSIGRTCCTWKDRACYTFDQYGNYIYVAKTDQPLMLNGVDFGILKAGDGRYNKVTAQRKFVNELMVWQEEIGSEGGCVTIFEGYSPVTFGRLVLSSKIGCMNAKSVSVVDGVMTSTETDARLKTLAFFLSRYGVCVTDGRTISIVSDDIQNYFDTTKSECIRAGQEQKMWLNHDAAENVIRVGLVISTPRSTGTTTSATAGKLVNSEASFATDGTFVGDTAYNIDDGTTALVTAIDSASTLSLDTDIMASGENYQILASTPNLFPVLDLVDKTWSFDEPGQVLGCLSEVSSDSDAIDQKPVIQLGGGVGDGTIYRLNDGADDVSTAIDSYIGIEISADGQYFILDEMAIRVKTQAAGDLTLTLYKNDVQVGTKTLDMTAAATGDSNRRHRFYLNIKGDTVTLRFQNNVAGQSFSLHDLGVGLEIWEGM